MNSNYFLNANEKVKKVSVGCGYHKRDGWWNVDIDASSAADEIIDVRKSFPYKNLEYIYAEHFIEHLSLDEFLTFLNLTWTSLSIGGKIRFSTPNLDWVLATFMRKRGERNGVEKSTLELNKAFHAWGHKFIYSDLFLKKVLEEFGFVEVKSYKFGQSLDPVFKNIERHRFHDDCEGIHSTLNIEAQKPIEYSEDKRSFLLERLENSFLKEFRKNF